MLYEQLLHAALYMMLFNESNVQCASTFSNFKYLQVFLAHLAHPFACSCSTTPLLWSFIKSMAYKIHPANTDDLQQIILECFQGIPHEMLQSLSYPLYHDCRSVMSDTVVSIKYHIQTVMINMNSHLHGMSVSVDKILPLCLKMVFNLRYCQVFVALPINTYTLTISQIVYYNMKKWNGNCQ